MKTLQKATIRHCIIAKVKLHTLTIKLRANLAHHYCRRRIDDHKVKLI